MTQLGVYLGNDPAQLGEYSSWSGDTPDNILFYLNDDSWADFDNSINWAAALWKPSNLPVIWSVPLTVTGTSLEQVASGAENAHFLKAAQALAQTTPSADGAIYVRVGWEFNGSWMPWASEGQEAAFVSAFQQVVNSFRSISDKFKFVWDVNKGGGVNPEASYPGDAFVDVIGMDVYYDKAWDSLDPLAAFQTHVSTPYGLQWQQDFATAHGKATAISEWGVNTDSAGPYIEKLVAWMSDHNMVYGNYWDVDSGGFDGELHNGQNPSAGAAYKAAVASLQGSSASAPELVPTEDVASNQAIVIHSSSAANDTTGGSVDANEVAQATVTTDEIMITASAVPAPTAESEANSGTAGNVAPQADGLATTSAPSLADPAEMTPIFSNLPVGSTEGASPPASNPLTTQNLVLGDARDNRLKGTDADDIIKGFGGNDKLMGRDGADTFFFQEFGRKNCDKITDYEDGTDRFGLDHVTFGLTSGELAPDAFIVGSKAQDSEDRIIYNKVTGNLLYDPDGNGNASAEVIANIGAMLKLSHHDILSI